MSVIQTDEWLLNFYDNPIEICKKLKKYFNHASEIQIYNYLISYGMYSQPLSNGALLVKRLQNKNIWQIIKEEAKQLQQDWQVPNVPIFIFPSESKNERLNNEFNGKAGLAFKDKLFLFISEHNKANEIKALFTHEYNHTSRLTMYEKREKDYNLLDTIIMEGLAEHAVYEKFDEKHLAPWTAHYSKGELEQMWNTIVLPNRNISINNNLYHSILYGSEKYPYMGGYSVGYYLVEKYLRANNLICKEIINKPSEEIAQIHHY